MKNLSKLSLEDLEDLLTFFPEEEDPKKHKEILTLWEKKRKKEKIRVPSLESRIFISFYERLPLRVFLLLWGIYMIGVEKNVWGFLLGAFFISTVFKLFLSYKGSWIRKRAKIKIVDQEGKEISFGKRFLREILKSFPLTVVFLLSMEFDPKRRGLHDKILGTYVVQMEEERDPSQIASFLKEFFFFS